MRLAKLDENLTNQKLATVIKSKDGRKLINEGTTLSTRTIERLINSGLNAIYIEDENTDIKLQESLEESKRIELSKKLKEIYDRIEKNEYNDVEFEKYIRTKILPEIDKDPISIPIGQIMDPDDIIQHSINVLLLAVRMANVMGLKQDKVTSVAKAALLHDIGKYLKNKDDELKNMKHEEIGFEFLKRKHASVILYMAVKFQSENYDGTGLYKIEEKNQNEIVKILTICDFYETLLRTTNLLPHESFERVQSLVNTKFDPEIFEVFRKSLYIYPIGLPVKLNGGEEGVIYMQNKSYPLRPVIKTKNMQYNLMEHLSLFIEQVII